MKQLVLIIAFFSIPSLFAQTSLTLDKTGKKGISVISPTWKNLAELMFCNNSVYQATMDKNKYFISSDKFSYVIKNEKGLQYSLITKTNAQVTIEFKRNEGFSAQLRKEMEEKTGGKAAEKQNGFDIFYSEYVSNGLTVKIKVGIKENKDNSTVVTFAPV
jgi:hypothetical protein